MSSDKMREYWLLAVKIIVAIVGLVVFLWLFGQILWVFSLFLVSLLIVYALAPLADWLESKKLSRLASTLIAFGAFLLGVAIILAVAIPRFYNEVMELTELFPWIYTYLDAGGIIEELQFFIEEGHFRQNGLDQVDDIDDLFTNGLAFPTELMQNLVNTVIEWGIVAVTAFFEIIILLILTFFLLLDFNRFKTGLSNLVPEKYRDDAVQLIEVVDLKVGQFWKGNLVRCTVVAVFTGVGLYLIGVRFHVMLALIAAILNIVAYIGPFVAAIPGIIVALTHSWEAALLAVVLYSAIQSLDAFILYPVLMGKAVDLSPFSVIVAISLGGALYGIIGFIISVPVVAVLKVMIHYYYLDIKTGTHKSP